MKKKKKETKAPEVQKDVRDEIPYLINPVTGLPDPNTGVAYDWNKVNKLYKTLKCPDDVYDPTHIPWNNAKYFLLASSRSVGKTTNVLLWSMCCVKLYPGTQIMYIRQREAMIERRYLDNTVGLMSVIRAFHYVEMLTDNKYNDVEYYARVWRYVLRGEDGKIVEKSEPFMVCLDIDQGETYKSTLAAPRGDILIFDEMISSDYRENEFVHYCDLVKTVLRDRLSPICICLMNNIDIYSPYLREFGVNKIFANLSEGDCTIHQTPKGTLIYCEYIGAKSKVRPLVNSQYFGFDNPLMTSITGGGGWAITPAPHIWRDETREVLQRGICLLYQEQVVELELCTNESVGLHVCAHMLRKLPSNPLTVYTIGEIRNPWEVYGFGIRRPVDKLIWGLFEQNKFYYSHDDVASIIDHFHAAA